LADVGAKPAAITSANAVGTRIDLIFTGLILYRTSAVGRQRWGNLGVP
jgi:hypothetical protein